MSSTQHPADDARTEEAFADDVRSSIALLEAIAADRALLDRLPPEERQRLHAAVGLFYHPDPVLRRRKRKDVARERNAAQVAKEESVLHSTGIRELRRRPVFTTPNVFVPEGFIQEDGEDNEPERREAIEPQHCYVCKQKYLQIHHFYDQLCPTCAEFNFAKRTETADLRGRVALLTGGRVKIGYWAGLKLLRATRRRVTRRNPTSATGRTGWRFSASTFAIRPASKRSAMSSSPRAIVSISSSTMPARPCVVHRNSTHT